MHPFIELTDAAFDPKKNKSEDLIHDFVKAFLTQEFYFHVSPVNKDDAELKFLMTQIESSGDLLLIGYLVEPEQAEGLDLVKINGHKVLTFSQQQRHVFAITDGDETTSLNHQQLLVIQQLSNLSNDHTDDNTATSALGVGNLALSYPSKFIKQLYKYCKTKPDIEQCWIALLDWPGDGLPQVTVIIDCTLTGFPEHKDALSVISNNLLPPGQLLSILESRSISDQLGTDKIMELKPYYSAKHSQSIWHRFLRKFTRIDLPYIQMQITPED
jgi:hypothetical protein